MAQINPLGLYSPFTTQQVKTLRKMRFSSGGPGDGTYNPVSFGLDWNIWNRSWASSNGDGCGPGNVNYAAQIQDIDAFLGSSSLVMSAVRFVANTLPEAPILVKEPGEKEGDTEIVKDHPMVELLRQPNEFYSGDALWAAFAYSWILNGNVYFLKIKDQLGNISQLWYEPHTTIRPVWDKDGDTFIDYYEVNRGSYKFRAEIGDVIHFRDIPNPGNGGRTGISLIASILRELVGDNAAADYGASLSGGGGVPSFVMSIDPQISYDEQAAQQLEELLHRKTSTGQRRPMVVYGGKVEQLTLTPEQMDVKVLRRLPEERFSAVTGIPAVVLELGAGHDHSMYNNVRQAVERAYEAYLIPLQRRIAAQINLQLLPEYEAEGSERYAAHDLSQVRALSEDEDAKAKRVALLYDSDILKRGEARSKMGFEVAEDGSDDVYKSEVTKANQPEPVDEQPMRLVKGDGLMPGKKDRPELKAVDRTLAREPTELEELVGYEDVLDEQDDSKDKITVVLLALTLLLGRQAVQMIGKLKPADFHTLTLDVPAPSYASVRTEIEGAYIRGAELVRQELIRQKAPVSVIGESIAELTKVAEKEIDTITEATVSRVVNQIQASASASASSGAIVGEEGKEIQARVQTALREASTAPVENYARGAASASLNRGRNLEFEKILRDLEGSDEEQGIYFIYTAIGDSNTCGPCLKADGENSTDLEDLALAPNPECEGWDKCRCWIICAFADNTSRDIRVGAA